MSVKIIGYSELKENLLDDVSEWADEYMVIERGVSLRYYIENRHLSDIGQDGNTLASLCLFFPEIVEKVLSKGRHHENARSLVISIWEKMIRRQAKHGDVV